MISLEGLTLTTGRHAEAGYILRTFAALRPRRPDPEPVPRGRERRALPHRRRDAVVLPRPRPLPRRDRRPRHAAALLPTLERHRRPPPARHALRHRRRPGGRAAAPGGGGLPAHLDGRQGGRLGGDAAARQGGGDQRPLVQRAAAAERLAARRRRAPTRRRAGGARGPRAASRSTAGSGTRTAATSTTWSTARTGDDPAVPAEPGVRDLAAAPGARRGALAAGAGRRAASELLTPVGLRSLAPGHPDYKPQYYGDLRARDAAYHQGTVWGWLIGPVRGRLAEGAPGRPGGRPRRCSTGFAAHLERGVHRASISEIFDAEAPYTPRGCVAQAWSVAEVLRCWVKTAPPASDDRGTSRR